MSAKEIEGIIFVSFAGASLFIIACAFAAVIYKTLFKDTDHE